MESISASLEFIVDNAHETFTRTLLSTRAKVLLIGGFTDEASAVKGYLAKASRKIDRRKNLNEADARYVATVERYAADAQEYVNWVRSDAGQPLWKDALVSYCTAFENCLKSIAVAFLIANRRTDAELTSQVIIPSEDLTRARHVVSKHWDKADGDFPKIRNFFESAIRSMPGARHYCRLEVEAAENDWEVCSAAFQVRNAIVHNLGVMPSTVSLGSLELHASWPIELTQAALAEVGDAFSRILEPFAFTLLEL